MSFWEYLGDRHRQLLTDACQQAGAVLLCVLAATLIGVLIGVLAHRDQRASTLATRGAATALAVPSLAVIGLLVAVMDPGLAPTLTALTLFGLLPVVRHSVAGLRAVDPSLVEAARAIGMSRPALLARVQLPLAWPPILTGVRVATRMLMGVAAIAAYASGPGLGKEIFRGIGSPDSANALNEVLAGTLGIIALTLLFDAAWVLLGRLTVSRGIRVRVR